MTAVERAEEVSGEWAAARETSHDMHRFYADPSDSLALLRARCNPQIRTYSRNTTPERDRCREPYMRLRTRAEIEASGFAYLYRFCPDCEALAPEREGVSVTAVERAGQAVDEAREAARLTNPNRAAYLALEPAGLTPDELWECTGCARCDDCGYLMRTLTLVTLPDHRCSRRQAMHRDHAARIAREGTDIIHPDSKEQP